MPAPQNPLTTARFNEITARLDDHQERLDQHEQRLNKYDVIIATLQGLQQTMSARLDIYEPLVRETAQALARLEGKQDTNRRWIEVVIRILLVVLGSVLGLLSPYVLHLLTH